MESLRKIMGVCPQHDSLYDNLTVKEHLEMYAVFKGVPKD
jgi:ATP-binding cassette subfamily A (ABC1) protein 3